jgi:hypothetical protein
MKRLFHVRESLRGLGRDAEQNGKLAGNTPALKL